MTPPYWFFNAHLRIVLDEQHTHSNYDLIEGRFPAGMETPLHLHTKYDELIYVLEGEFTVYTNTGAATLTAGEHIFIPRNTPHVVAAPGKTINRALSIASPSGFGKLLRAIGIPDIAESIPPGQSNDMGLFLELSNESGDVILGTPGARPTLYKTDEPEPD